MAVRAVASNYQEHVDTHARAHAVNVVKQTGPGRFGHGVKIFCKQCLRRKGNVSMCSNSCSRERLCTLPSSQSQLLALIVKPCEMPCIPPFHTSPLCGSRILQQASNLPVKHHTHALRPAALAAVCIPTMAAALLKALGTAGATTRPTPACAAPIATSSLRMAPCAPRRARRAALVARVAMASFAGGCGLRQPHPSNSGPCTAAQ